MRKGIATALGLVMVLSAGALAQTAPAPPAGSPQVLSPQITAPLATTPPIPVPAPTPAPSPQDVAPAAPPADPDLGAVTLHGPGIAIDGFTIDLGTSPEDRRRLRLISIDVPEMGRPGSIEARVALDDLLRPGPIDCVLTGDKVYQRELARCSTGDGRDLGETLLRAGVVTTARHFLIGRPWAQAYIDAEHAGLAAQRTAAAAAAPSPPPAPAAEARPDPAPAAATAPAAAPPPAPPQGFWARNTRSEILAAWIQALGSIAAILAAGIIAGRRR